MTILIADDNEQNGYQLQILLGGHGYQVVTAANGAEALAQARQNPPDLIITDILMPVMDGFALCREWQKDKRLQTIPLVFYTATYTDSRDCEFALSLGAARFLVKPAEPEAFIKVIQDVLASHKQGTLAAARSPVTEETVFLKQYNETLIRKLDAKVQQLEQTNREMEQDIAARKQTETALRLAHERLRRFVDANIVGILIANAAGAVIEANDYYLRLIGHTREELEHGLVNWRAITPPEWLPADEHAIQELREKGTCTPYEKEYVRRDGTRIQVLLADAMLPGPGEQIAAFALDITQRKQAEEALLRSADALKASNEELVRFNRAAVGRELRMIELKQEVNALCQRLGEPLRYETAVPPGGPPPPARPESPSRP